MPRSPGSLLRAILILIALPAPTHADILTLNPDRDNTLYEDAEGDLSNGAGQHLFAGRTGTNFPVTGFLRRALLRFDLSSIPAGSIISTVTLRLHVSAAAPGSAALEHPLHRVTADWGEGGSNAFPMPGGVGAPAQAGDATWIHRFHNTSTWSNPGSDFSPMISTSIPVGGPGNYTWPSSPRLVADVQGWYENPQTNFGWILIGDESQIMTAKRFDSRENSTHANRPVLTIDFAPPDCNGNGLFDANDVAAGRSADCDANGVPDECQADSDSDGAIDNCDGCPQDAAKVAPGACGCGVAEADANANGRPDCLDPPPPGDQQTPVDAPTGVDFFAALRQFCAQGCALSMLATLAMLVASRGYFTPRR